MVHASLCPARLPEAIPVDVSHFDRRAEYYAMDTMPAGIRSAEGTFSFTKILNSSILKLMISNYIFQNLKRKTLSYIQDY